jgi:ATP-binding cassette, subfamily F, member 3
MAVASFTDIEKGYAGKSILRGITFELQQGQKIGLVGPNGAGKTTLLKLLAGEEKPDHGDVTISKNVKWTYVSQHPRLDPEETLRHQVSLVFEELHAIEKQMHETADLLSVHTSGPQHDAALEKYGELEHHFQHMGGYDIERRVETVLDELGFAQRDLDLPIKALSGGQKSRAQIARLLLEAPDLMFLDEPTNHLDLPMLDWLEKTLNEMTDTTLVVVSHDRYFMDSVVDEILELKDGKIEHFPGNYSAYLDLRQERLLAQQHSFEQQRAYIEKQEEYIRRFGAGQRAMQARGRKTRLERLKESGLINKPRFKDKSLILNLKVPKASGYDVLKAEGLSKAFPDKTLFQDIDLTVVRGKRLGIIGPNGSGKTTLLNILAGEMPADRGTIKWGHGVALQFYKQEHQDLDPNNNIIDELQSVRIDAKQQELRDLAALFLFSGDSIEKKLGVLSGGEKSRVAMAKLLLKPTNTILMDEPTNHLDIATCDVLEEALDSYDGTLILVSHDRFFMDQVCDQLLVLQRPKESGGKPTWKLYNGSYTAYLAAIAKEKEQAANDKRYAEKAERQAQQEREAQAKAREKAAAQKGAGNSKPKVPQKFAKLSVEQMEAQIGSLERDIASLEESFANPKLAANPQAVKDLRQKYDAKKRDLQELTAAWEIKAEAAS